MPTGYTADIANDISFEEYALRCARAFGAFIHQRDDSLSDGPKLREESNYYQEKVIEAEAELGALQTMTMEQKEATGQELKDAEIEQQQKWFNEKVLLKNKYEAMLAKVNEWTPPTSEHAQLKQFMADQIVQSIDFDCNTAAAIESLRKASEMTPLEYYAKEVKDLEWKVIYYAEEADKEQKRNTEANAWIDALCGSLGVAI